MGNKSSKNNTHPNNISTETTETIEEKKLNLHDKFSKRVRDTKIQKVENYKNSIIKKLHDPSFIRFANAEKTSAIIFELPNRLDNMIIIDQLIGILQGYEGLKFSKKDTFEYYQI